MYLVVYGITYTYNLYIHIYNVYINTYMTDFRQIDICPYFLNTDEIHTARKKMWQGISQPQCSHVNFSLY